MKIKATKPFTVNSSGALTSYACGEVVEVTTEVGNAYITAGLAEEYTLLTPTGNKNITANGTGIDVAQYATVSVAVG